MSLGHLTTRLSHLFAVSLLLVACTHTPPTKSSAAGKSGSTTSEYRIGPGDQLQVFVWRNPEISVTVPVRPDGRISTPLVEDMVAVGKTPSQLARDIEQALARYVRTPIVTVIVTGFVGTFSEQIRVVGQATNPKALSYREKMTLLDVMIEVGGLAQFAAGNRATLVRRVNGQEEVMKVRLEDLMKKGDISANVTMHPGDILIIPEARF
jgi:polysaccharide biosynthesis/export protein